MDHEGETRVLRLRNFGGHDRLDVSFPTRGLVRIQGPSGAGKSTVLDAFAWVLGFGSDNPKGVMTTAAQATGTTRVSMEWDDVEIVRTCRPAKHALFSRSDGSEINSDPVGWLVRRYGACLHGELLPVCAYLRQGLRCALSSDPTPTYRALAENCLHPLPVVEAGRDLAQAARDSDAVAGDRAKRWRDSMDERPRCLGPVPTDAPEAALQIPDPPARAPPCDQEVAAADEAVGGAKARALAAADAHARLTTLWRQMGTGQPLPSSAETAAAVAWSLLERGRAQRLIDRFEAEFADLTRAGPLADAAAVCAKWAEYPDTPGACEAERTARAVHDELQLQLGSLVGPSALGTASALTLALALACKRCESLALEEQPRAQRAWLHGTTAGPEWAEAAAVEASASTPAPTVPLTELRDVAASLGAAVAVLDAVRAEARVAGGCCVTELTALVAGADAAREGERVVMELEADPVFTASLAIHAGRTTFRGWTPPQAGDPLPGPDAPTPWCSWDRGTVAAAVAFLASLVKDGQAPGHTATTRDVVRDLELRKRAADRDRASAMFPAGLFAAPLPAGVGQVRAASEELCLVARELETATRELERCTAAAGDPRGFARDCAAKDALELCGAGTAGDARRGLLAVSTAPPPAGWAVACGACGAGLRVDPATGAAACDSAPSPPGSWPEWLLAAPAAAAPCARRPPGIGPEQRAAAAAALCGLGDDWDGAWLPPDRSDLLRRLAALPDRVTALRSRARAIYSDMYGDMSGTEAGVKKFDETDSALLTSLNTAVALSKMDCFPVLYEETGLGQVLAAAGALSAMAFRTASVRLAGTVPYLPVSADREETARRLLGRARDACQRAGVPAAPESAVRDKHAAAVAACTAEELRLAAREAVRLRDRVRASRAACGLPPCCNQDEPCFLSRRQLDVAARNWVATDHSDTTLASAAETHERLCAVAWATRAGRLARSPETAGALAARAAASPRTDEAALGAATELLGLAASGWPDPDAAQDDLRAREQQARDLRALVAQWADWRAVDRWAAGAGQLLRELREAESAASANRLASSAIQDATASAVDTVTREIEATANRMAHRLFPEGGVLIRLRPGTKGQLRTLTVGVRIGNRDAGIDAVGLSGGERARVDLALQAAACVAMGSPILLLDESTGSLDPDTAALSVAALRGVAADRLVVVASHQLEGDCLPLFDSVVKIAPPMTTGQAAGAPPPKRRRKA